MCGIHRGPWSILHHILIVLDEEVDEKYKASDQTIILFYHGKLHRPISSYSDIVINVNSMWTVRNSVSFSACETLNKWSKFRDFSSVYVSGIMQSFMFTHISKYHYNVSVDLLSRMLSRWMLWAKRSLMFCLVYEQWKLEKNVIFAVNYMYGVITVYLELVIFIRFFLILFTLLFLVLINSSLLKRYSE